MGGTAGAGGLSALGLEAPVEAAELGSGVAALGAGCGQSCWWEWILPSTIISPPYTIPTPYSLCFCLWNERLPQRRQSVWLFEWRLPLLLADPSRDVQRWSTLLNKREPDQDKGPSVSSYPLWMLRRARYTDLTLVVSVVDDGLTIFVS